MTNKNEIPDNAEFGLLIAYLASRGMTAQAARAVIGSSPQGRTRAQIADELKAWMKGLPKA